MGLCKIAMNGRSPVTLVVDSKASAHALSISDVVLGDAVECSFVFTPEHRKAFAECSGDMALLHVDRDFAIAQGFEETIIQGLCVSSRFSRLIGMFLPGERAILQSVNFKYFRPTYEGQELLYRVEVSRMLAPMKVVKLALRVSSAAGIHVLGEAQCLIR